MYKKHEKLCRKCSSKIFFWNSQQMGKVTRLFCWHQDFVHKGFSVPAPGLYTCGKTLKKIWVYQILFCFCFSYLQNNKLTSLPSGGDFEDLTVSGDFSLENNRIVTLKTHVFKNLNIGGFLWVKYSRNKFHFSDINRSMNAMGRLQSKWCPKSVMLTLHAIVFILLWMSEKWYSSLIFTLF